MSTFVGVVTSLSPASKGRHERATLSAAYIKALEEAGLIPLLITPGMRPETIHGIVDVSNGICLTGGGDIDPRRYGQRPSGTMMDSVVEARDSTEIDVLASADRSALPVLAICRGMQLLNVGRGGTLHQHVPNHSQTDDGTPRDRLTHVVRVNAETRLARILGVTSLGTNSMHHQAVDKAGDRLTVTGWAEDGTIEAIEEPGERFVVGVQWHPEELVATQEEARRLFSAFARACFTRVA